MPSPLWVIGIDGCEPALLHQWCDEGVLPNLATCRARGSSGALLSTTNMLTSAAWTTIATGANPGRHGIYNFAERVCGEYRLRLPTAQDRQLPSFWEIASEAGRTVISARVPMSYPVGPVNGLQVADSLAPSPSVPGFAYPPSLARDLRRRFGHAFWLEPVDLIHSGRYYHILKGLLDSVDRTFELFRYLLARERADLFFGVVREADYAGHSFWGFHSGRLSTHDPYLANDLQPALRQVYERVDQRLGELLEHMPSQTNLLIVSDHGMGAEWQGPSCVGPLLEAAGLMVQRTADDKPAPGRWQRAREEVSRRVPWSLRRRLRPLSSSSWSQGFTQSHLAAIDFGQSRAFSYLSGLAGEVWLNLKGRDPQGMVEASGDEQAELEHDIAELFGTCRESHSDKPLATRVWRRDELFNGPCRDRLADVHISLDLDLPIESLYAQFRGREVALRAPRRADGRTGTHRPLCTFLASGPDIASGGPGVTGTLMDVAPTVLALLDVPIPESMEGRALEAALHPWVRPRAGGVPDFTPAALPEPRYTESDLALVEQRLTNLGYL
ncbi:MAG: alkaline phosphatase family protein [Armatimonadota bacterium]